MIFRRKTIVAYFSVLALLGGPINSRFVLAADEKNATEETEQGGKPVGRDVTTAGKNLGRAVDNESKTVGQKFREAGKAVAPEAKATSKHIKEGAVVFGKGAKKFFKGVFGRQE